RRHRSEQGWLHTCRSAAGGRPRVAFPVCVRMTTVLDRSAMRRHRPLFTIAWLVTSFAAPGRAQKILTWDEAKRELEAANPTLRADQIAIQQSRAEEITAFLRPNPEIALSGDQVNPITGNPYRPFTDSIGLFSIDYLVERRGKRDLRRESARKNTDIAISLHD